MKKLLKKIIASGVDVVVKGMALSRGGRYFLNQFASSLMHRSHTVDYNGHQFLFLTPNFVNYFRATTFSTKEPETLEWIEMIPDGAVLWDIGANVGLYSICAAKTRNCIVYAFEPSVFNLELLAGNIFHNRLVEQITIVPVPLSDKLQRNTLNMSSTEWGGALSTFGESYGHDGKELDKVFEFATIGMNMEDAVKRLDIPYPDYIKMDVDGIEQLILEGGRKVLERVQGVLVEVNDDFVEQRDAVSRILMEAGLTLREKRHADMFEGSKLYGNLYNQIWERG